MSWAEAEAEAEADAHFHEPKIYGIRNQNTRGLCQTTRRETMPQKLLRNMFGKIMLYAGIRINKGTGSFTVSFERSHGKHKILGVPIMLIRRMLLLSLVCMCDPR